MGLGDSPRWVSDGRAVRLVRHDPGSPIDASRWPATVPAVEQLLGEGLELPPGLTVLVGENGSGKSTVMEMLAEACGLNPQGGSAQARLFRTRDSEPGLGTHLIVERGPVRPRWSYFLRADTMHTLYTYLEDRRELSAVAKQCRPASLSMLSRRRIGDRGEVAFAGVVAVDRLVRLYGREVAVQAG